MIKLNKRSILAVCSFLILATASFADVDANDEKFKKMWDFADKPHQINNYKESEKLYKELLKEFPKSQRAALRIAIAQENQGKAKEALSSYDFAFDIDPKGEWAPFALYYKARAASESGYKEESEKACKILYSIHPDSAFVARAKLLEAGEDVHKKKEMAHNLEIEMDAAGLFEEASKLSAQKKDIEALQKFQSICFDYPETATSLRAAESCAHILLRNQKYAEAANEFSAIISKTEKEFPESRIYSVAKRILAGIYHVMKDRDSAIETFYSILNDSNASLEDKSDAILQITGLYFELLQHDSVPTVQDWDEFHKLCTTARATKSINEQQLCRIDLMELESYGWQGLSVELQEAAKLFLSTYSSEKYPVETATAHMVYAFSLRRTGNYDESLTHWDAIIKLYPEGKDEIWPKMDHLPRVYFERYKTLLDMSAAKHEVASAANALIKRFPESSYTKHVITDMPLWN